MCYVFLTPLLPILPFTSSSPSYSYDSSSFRHHSVPLLINLSLSFDTLSTYPSLPLLISLLHFTSLLFSFHCLPLFSYLSLSLSLATSLFPLLSPSSSLPSFFIHFTFLLTLPQLILFPPLIYFSHSFDTISFHSYPPLHLHSYILPLFHFFSHSLYSSRHLPLSIYEFLSYIICAVSTQWSFFLLLFSIMISLSILSLPFLLNSLPSLFSLSPFFHPLSDPIWWESSYWKFYSFFHVFVSLRNYLVTFESFLMNKFQIMVLFLINLLQFYSCMCI